MDMPLYVSIAEAARFVGIGEKAMRDLLNSNDPPPYLLVGREKRPQLAALEKYFHERQEIK